LIITKQNYSINQKSKARSFIKHELACEHLCRTSQDKQWTAKAKQGIHAYPTKLNMAVADLLAAYDSP
jgi:hypothetical protein